MDNLNVDRLIGQLRSLGYEGKISKEQLEVWFHLKNKRIQAFLHWLISTQKPLLHSTKIALSPEEYALIHNDIIPNGNLFSGKHLQDALRGLKATSTARDSHRGPAPSSAASVITDRLLARNRCLVDMKAVLANRQSRLEESVTLLTSRELDTSRVLAELKESVVKQEEDYSTVCASVLHSARALLRRKIELEAGIRRYIPSTDASDYQTLLARDTRVSSTVELQKQVEKLGETASMAQRRLAFAKVRNAALQCEVSELRRHDHESAGDEAVMGAQGDPSDMRAYEKSQRKLAETLRRISARCKGTQSTDKILRQSLRASTAQLRQQLSGLQELTKVCSSEVTTLQELRGIIDTHISLAKQGVAVLDSTPRLYSQADRDLHPLLSTKPSTSSFSIATSLKRPKGEGGAPHAIYPLGALRQEVQEQVESLQAQYLHAVNTFETVSADVRKLKEAKERLRARAAEVTTQFDGSFRRR